jgi:leader peptidase (prepilin peptidase) / N-methyltransferase
VELLFGAALLLAVAVGPWLARAAARLATRDEYARASLGQSVAVTLLFVALVGGAVLLTGDRPATAALVWAAGAAVVLAWVDLASHRLPVRVIYPAAVVCGAAFLVDAAVLDSWAALVRALAAGLAAFAVPYAVAAISPEALGLGDVKLLGLLGLVLGWFGWGVLLAGVFLGLLTGALVSLVLLAARRAGWRTALPFGPPLLLGAVLALLAESGACCAG